MVIVKAEAEQGGNRIIRNGEAELGLAVGHAPFNLDGVEITPRQSFILRKVVEAHVELDQPVGSKWLAELDDVPWGPSTVRAELARLEEAGLLEHPHTSAGRVPTDRGYRIYVDELLAEGRLPVPRKTLELSTMRREVDEAMRATSEQLSQVTNLLALVTAPPIETATIRRVEVLLLQPQVAMVVVITSTGGVTKRVISYDEPVDPGPRGLGRQLPERGARRARRGLARAAVAARGAASWRAASARSWPRSRPPSPSSRSTAANTLFVEGAGRLLSEHRFQELSQIGALMESARAAACAARRAAPVARPSRASTCASAARTRRPELRSLSLVAANYGLARRNLGAVSVIGPLRMDYPNAIIAVRQAARELSRFVAEVYDE